MYCTECGNKLELRFLEFEGMIPYCNKCNEYRFQTFNSAVSLLIFNPDMTKTLFVKQYGTDFYRLVAGYVNKGESLEETIYREMGEEIGRIPCKVEYNSSAYFKKSNTLISNYAVVLTSEEIFPNHEIDSYGWIDIKDSREELRRASFSYEFLCKYLDKKNMN